MSQILHTTTSAETQEVARQFAAGLQMGDIIVLRGNLGAGKTTFVQGLAQGLGITKRIISPTFVIIRTYNNSVTVPFYHVDLYRLSGEQDIEATGLLEILEKKDSIVAIEWPEKMGSLLPEKRREVSFDYVDENKRKITIKNMGIAAEKK